jgi:hypothetical protein
MATALPLPSSYKPPAGGLPAVAFASPSDDPSKTPPPVKLGQGAAGEFAGNAVRAVAAPLQRTGAAIESGLDETVGRLATGIASKGKSFAPTQTGAAAFKAADATDAGASTTTAGKVGTGVGVVAPYLLGAGEEEAGMAGTEVAAKTGSKILGSLAKGAVRSVPNSAIGTAQTGSLKKGVETGVTASVGQGLLDGAGNVVKGIIGDGAKSMKAVGAAEAKTQNVIDMISPKINAKETKLALRDGRIAPGQDPTLLKGGTKDQILPSKATEKAAQTVNRTIDDAHKMTQPQLHVALGSKVKEIAGNLKPEMQKVPIQEKVVQNITDSWSALKKQQLADPYMDTSANVEKLQQQFEQNFLQKSNANNLNDLWETRIGYDNSVPSNVKDATSLSSDKLQTQKAIWLQNRAILNGAINDSVTGLGQTSQKAFADMSDLYNAQKGIESSYKVTEGAPSKLKGFIDSPKGKILRGALELGGAGIVGDKLLKGATGIGY